MDRIQYLWKLVRLEVYKMKFVHFSKKQPLFKSKLNRKQTFRETMRGVVKERCLKGLNHLVVNPTHRYKVFWDNIMIIAFLGCIFVDFLNAGFAYKLQTSLLHYLFFFDIIFLCDAFVTLLTTYEKRDIANKFETDFHKVVCYNLQKRVLFEMTACIPNIIVREQIPNLQYLKIFRFV